jgi:HK97 family phage major capsid protein
MEVKEITDALEGIKSAAELKNTEVKAELKGLIETLEAKMATNESIDTLKEELKAIQDHANKLDVKLQEKNFSEVKNYGDAIANEIKTNFETIKNVRKGASAKLEVKAVGDMTIAANLTGGAVKTYQPGVVMNPSQKINFSDLVPTISSATGIYIVYKENGAGEGSISTQTEGGNKSQRDYDFTEVTYNASYLSGYTRFSKQMSQDLPFLQSFLPDALRRDYLKAENLQFYTALAAAATASTTAKTVDVEQVVDDMGALEAADYEANGIVMNPKDWYSIALTKPSDYSLPGVVMFQNGVLTINGVPVYKATWCPVDKYIIGDWSNAKKVAVDGLAVEFFEQDGNNVTQNKITARIEQRVVLAIDDAKGFILGDFGNVA